MKNEITKQIRCSKKAYYNEYFSKNSKNIKKIWAGVNQILNRKNHTNNSPTCIEIDVNGNVHTITDPKQIAEEFNKHYATVADKILKKRRYGGKAPYHAYLKNPNPNSFMITPTTTNEIIDIISNIDPSKSVGPNSIPNQLLQSVKHAIAKPLANIFNRSFQVGSCPTFLKMSTTIPIHKKKFKAHHF